MTNITIRHETKLHEALHYLKEGRAYLTNPKHWIKNRLATGNPDADVNGETGCAPFPMVCSWGALSKVRAQPIKQATAEPNQPNTWCDAMFLEQACQALDFGSIVGMNDGRRTTHKDMLAVWGLAISRCEKAIKEYETGKEMDVNHDSSHKAP